MELCQGGPKLVGEVLSRSAAVDPLQDQEGFAACCAELKCAESEHIGHAERAGRFQDLQPLALALEHVGRRVFVELHKDRAVRCADAESLIDVATADGRGVINPLVEQLC